MINLDRSVEPHELRIQRGSNGSLDSRLGGVLRPVLRSMQENRCAYCESGLPSKFTIEHFHPNSKGSCTAGALPVDGNWNLTWDNLFASCDDASDRANKARAKGCSAAKRDNDICLLAYKPTELTGPSFTVRGATGELVPTASDPKLATTIEALGLNRSHLNQARKAIVDTLRAWADVEELAELELMFVQPDVPFCTTVRSLFE